MNIITFYVEYNLKMVGKHCSGLQWMLMSKVEFKISSTTSVSRAVDSKQP